MPERAITSNRAVTVSFDISEDFLTEHPFHMERRADDLNPLEVSGCIRLKSGVWVLQPVNDLTLHHEDTDAQALVLRKSTFATAAHVVEIPYQRKFTELTGVAPAANVATSGDYYMTKRVAAGASWNQTTPDDTYGQPTLPTANYPLDNVCGSTAAYEADTGYVVKLLIPGAHLQTSDWFFGLKFGGPLFLDASALHDGYGLFFLALAGDGRAQLYEYIDGDWEFVDLWRFASPLEMMAGGLLMRILPHAGRWIEFATFTSSAEPRPVIGGHDRTQQSFAVDKADGSTIGAHLIEVNDRGSIGNFSDEEKPPVTGFGFVNCYVRRDMRLRWQIQRIGYAASGIIADRAFTVPYGLGTAHIIYATVHPWVNGFGTATSPPGEASIILQGATGAALTPDTENVTFRGVTTVVNGYTMPAVPNMRAVITLTNLESAGNRWHTPVLIRYTVRREGHIQTVAPGTKTGGLTLPMSITGASFDPEHETMRFSVEDPTNALAFLRQRGKAGVRVETTFDAAGIDKVVLFEGYTTRVNAALMGKAGQVYPTANWHHLTIEAVGKWERLHSHHFVQQRYNFGNVNNVPYVAAPQLFKPWKVTDIIAFLLREMGVPEDMIDVFDDPQEVFARPGEGSDIFVPRPGGFMVEYCRTIARDYLNAYFLWDANAGTKGMFRLRQPPSSATVPLAIFTTGRPTGVKMAELAASYGTTTVMGTPVQRYPILEQGGVRYNTYVVPPEANVLTVIGATIRSGAGFEQHLKMTYTNLTSFNSPDHPATANIADIDYLGRMVAAEYVDTSLTKANAISWIGRRIYNLACKGRKYAEFIAEHVLVAPTTELLADGSPAYTTHPRRPLIPGDIVYIDADPYVIEGVNPRFRKDRLMLAHYEAFGFRENETYAS